MAVSRDLDFARLLVTFTSLVLAAAVSPGAALATFPGSDGVIAYSHEGRIWAVEPYTSNQLQLTSGPGDSAPSFSPSGTRLAFQRATAEAATVYLANADGSDPIPLVGGSEPAFSPNGRQIVFVRADGLFLTSLTPGGPVRQLTNVPGDHHPEWGANGSIVFQRTEISHRVVTCIRNPTSDRAVALLLERGERYCKRLTAIHEYATLLRSDLEIITPPSLRVRQILSYQAELSTKRQINEASSETVEMYPDWAPDVKEIAAALCPLEPLERPAPVLATVPPVVFHERCTPAVWSPSGQQLVEPSDRSSSAPLVAPPRPGMAFTSCPDAVEGLIAWQPLVNGTPRVPTVRCEEHASLPVSYHEVSPGEVVSGGHLCTYFPRRHRTICTTTR
jgi:WD40-like Beta Propeller Repeat